MSASDLYECPSCTSLVSDAELTEHEGVCAACCCCYDEVGLE